MYCQIVNLKANLDTRLTKEEAKNLIKDIVTSARKQGREAFCFYAEENFRVIIKNPHGYDDVCYLSYRDFNYRELAGDKSTYCATFYPEELIGEN